MLLCIYAVLAGPEGLHDDSWKELQVDSLIKLDLPTFMQQQGLKIIGRVSCEHFMRMAFAMGSCAKQTVDLY